METEYVYVLKLEEGKFYVGKSKDVDARLRYHRKGANARAWTAKYKPVPGDDAIYYQEVMKHNTYEDAMTEKVMFDFGIENVRGGTYSQEKLPPHQVQTLEDKKCTWEDLCFMCKKKGHMSRFCPSPYRRAFEASSEPDRQEDAATSTVDELAKSLTNLRVEPTCGENGGKTQSGKPCGNKKIGKVCQRCYWHCNDKNCKLPKRQEWSSYKSDTRVTN